MRHRLFLSSVASIVVVFAIACSGDPADDRGGSTFDDDDGGDFDANVPALRPDASPPPPGRAPEPCDQPGALESVKCGRCGTTQRFCSSSGIWEYGPCTAEQGACRPGEFRESSCGNCGKLREVCTDACAWSAIGSCGSEGVCKPGLLIRSREGCATGQRDLRCNDACVYEPASECTVDRCDTLGVTETVRCGNCGSRTRFCAASREWEYGPCTGEGGCAPGTSGETACGNCGTQSRRCNDRCEWVPFGECANTGECAPGATTRRSAGCPDGQSQSFTCSDACRFEPLGPCQAPARGKLGELCVNGLCEAPLVCDSGPGVGLCRQPCVSDAACGAGVCRSSTVPGPDGGTLNTCSDACTPFTSAGCPASMKCDFVGLTTVLFGAGTRMFSCNLVGTGGQGQLCSAQRDCARDHACIRSADGGTARCRQLCETTAGGVRCPLGWTCKPPTNLLGPAETLGWCE